MKKVLFNAWCAVVLVCYLAVVGGLIFLAWTHGGPLIHFALGVLGAVFFAWVWALFNFRWG